MKKRSFIILCIVALFITLCATQCENVVDHVFTYIAKQQEERRKYPNSGTYECNELGMIIAFEPDNMMLYDSNGTVLTVYVTHYGKFIIAEKSTAYEEFVVERFFTASYYWDQKKDILEIKFWKPFDDIKGIEENVKYYFYRKQ